MAEAITYEDSNSPEILEEKKEAEKITAKLFETKLFSDITFVVEGVKFRAHKSVLGTRYEYFEKLFGDWKEAEQNQITIRNIAPEVFKIVLEFVYKGKLSSWVEKCETYAVDLIKASNMFAIGGLRNKCEKYLIRAGKINVETACELFILADQHNASKLKAAVFEFISGNLEEVKKTNGYKALKRHHTSTADIFEMLSPSKRPKLLD